MAAAITQMRDNAPANPARYFVELWLKKHVQAVVYVSLGVLISRGGSAIFSIICTTFLLRFFIVS